MTKVLFVCLGNICRSPMAEYVLKDVVKRQGREDEFYIDSAATSTEEIGNPVYPQTRRKLKEEGIECGNHKARQMTKKDYEEFDYIIGMEEGNIRNILRIVGEDRDNKVSKLLDFTSSPRNIADPWYTRDFDTTYREIVEGLVGFLDFLDKEAK